jgi:hypothetical protein
MASTQLQDRVHSLLGATAQVSSEQTSTLTERLRHKCPSLEGFHFVLAAGRERLVLINLQSGMFVVSSAPQDGIQIRAACIHALAHNQHSNILMIGERLSLELIAKLTGSADTIATPESRLQANGPRELHLAQCMAS